ncbi:hypothetical protein [Bacillus weihaiensis]|uniref:hypothetical protein n=1 Tax=Bacillus weihaiensis TaxID=1547283 RepID=UPI0023566C03|nr:hypothetical protein [Bacillus weihaiensis]
MNMEQEGYDFKSLFDEVHRDYNALLKDPYLMNTSQAVGFLEDQYDQLRLKYPGFTETLYVILTDILVKNKEYSSRIFSKVSLIIENNELQKNWEMNKVSNEEINQREKYLKLLRENMGKING